MADFTALKTAIQNAIKQNGNEEITGNILQEMLLAIVTTLGDGSINDLITALDSEATTRGNADTTLQQNIDAEAQARGNADTTLGGRIDAEAQARSQADTALGGRIDGVVSSIEAINNAIENGYVYAGIATPSSTPTTGKVFYLALTAGTYTNFGNIAVTQGINILKYNGSAWSLDAFVGIDDEPIAESNNLVKSGGVFEKVNLLKQSVQKGNTDIADDLTSSFLFTQSAGILASDGIFYSGEAYVNYKATQNAVDVWKYNKILISVVNRQSGLGIAFYDSRNNLVRGISFTSLQDTDALQGNLVEIDTQGARYLKVTYYSDAYKETHDIKTAFCCYGMFNNRLKDYTSTKQKAIENKASINNVDNALDDLVTKVLTDNIEFTANTLIIAAESGLQVAGDIVSTPLYKTSGYIDISDFDFLKVSFPNIRSKGGIVFYDNFKNVINAIPYESVYNNIYDEIEQITIDVKDYYYARYSILTTQTDTDFIGYLNGFVKEDITDSFVFTQSAYLFTADAGGGRIVNVYIDGDSTYHNYMAHKGYVDISKYERLSIPTLNYPTKTGIIFYNEDFEVVEVINDESIYDSSKGYKVSTRYYDVSNYSYVRLSYWSDEARETYELPAFKCVGFYKEIVDVHKESEILSGCVSRINNSILEDKRETILNVEDFDSISECLEFRSHIDGLVKIVFNTDHLISEAILIPSDTTIVINNCTIKQANYTFDNVFRTANVVLNDEDLYYIPDTITPIRNVSIIGIGNAQIVGPDINRTDADNHDSPMVSPDVYGARTTMVDLCFVEGGEVSGLKVYRPRGWSFCFEYCSDYVVRDIYVDSTDMDKPYNAPYTGDAIDIRTGCHDFKVYNISGTVSDDLVALNTGANPNAALPARPAEYTRKCTIALSPEQPHIGDIYNIIVRDILKKGLRDNATGSLVRLNCKFSHELYNVTICNGVYSGMAIAGQRFAILFSAFGAGDGYINNSIHDVYINNIAVKDVQQVTDYVLWADVKVLGVWANKLSNDSGGDISYYQYDSGLTITNSETSGS